MKRCRKPSHSTKCKGKGLLASTTLDGTIVELDGPVDLEGARDSEPELHTYLYTSNGILSRDISILNLN